MAQVGGEGGSPLLFEAFVFPGVGPWMEVGTLAALLEQLVLLRESNEAVDHRAGRLEAETLEALTEVHERIDLVLESVSDLRLSLQQAFVSLTLLQHRLRILEDNAVLERTHAGFLEQMD